MISAAFQADFVNKPGRHWRSWMNNRFKPWSSPERQSRCSPDCASASCRLYGTLSVSGGRQISAKLPDPALRTNLMTSSDGAGTCRGSGCLEAESRSSTAVAVHWPATPGPTHRVRGGSISGPEWGPLPWISRLH